MNPLQIVRMEFHISYACANNCIFCSESDQLNRFKDVFVDKNIIFEALGKAVKKGISHISFTGGEPTLHPDIVEILSFAKSCGLKTYIGSNGSSFASDKFCDAVLPYLDEVCLSIHGPCTKIHNTHTSNPQSFNRLKKAFSNINNNLNPVTLFSNTVITPYNMDFLLEIVDFVSHFRKLRHMLFSFVAPDGKGLRHFCRLTPRLRSITRLLPDLSRICEKKSIDLKFFGMPLCALRNYEKLSNDLYWSPRVTFELWKGRKATYLKRTKNLRPIRNRTKLFLCRRCIKKDLCGGVFYEYAHTIEPNEIRPIK